jgi:hypothetical protein
MTAFAARRLALPLPLLVGFAAVGWLVAWFVNLPAANWIAFELIGLEPGTHVGEAVAFFVYDVPKVLLLLTGVIWLVSFIRSFVSPDRVRQALAGRGAVPGTVAAAGFAAEIRHVVDYPDIVARGVMSTPGLAIDGRVMLAGRVPTREQVAAWLGVA